MISFAMRREKDNACGSISDPSGREWKKHATTPATNQCAGGIRLAASMVGRDFLVLIDGKDTGHG
jgi:hypothetical protein